MKNADPFVSKIGKKRVPPSLAALAAMYAGFRAFGVAGMILLPVALLFV